MKAVQFQGVDKLALAEIDVPSIKADEVLVTLRSVGICHSDFELLEGRYIIPFDYPIIPGHEWSGQIAEVGGDVVMEASGQPQAMASALQVAGFNARLVNIGIDVGRSAEAQLGLIQSKSLQIRGTIGSPGVWPQTLRFLARTGLDLSPMVTRRFPLDEAPDAYEAARHTGENIKVHIENGNGR
jgi:threonine dehydrogenase-like Zn-dependent dehydrogenase